MGSGCAIGWRLYLCVNPDISSGHALNRVCNVCIALSAHLRCDALVESEAVADLLKARPARIKPRRHKVLLKRPKSWLSSSLH